jgi:hypothetical protein
MNPESSAVDKDTQERVPFPELETTGDLLSKSVIFELTPNGEFSAEQAEKMKNIGEETDNGQIKYYDFRNVTFSFPGEEKMFLCLGNLYFYPHLYMWEDLRNQFGQDLVLRDGGKCRMYPDEFVIRRYFSLGFTREENLITREECLSCREKLLNMGLGLTIE